MSVKLKYIIRIYIYSLWSVWNKPAIQAQQQIWSEIRCEFKQSNWPFDKGCIIQSLYKHVHTNIWLHPTAEETFIRSQSTPPPIGSWCMLTWFQSPSNCNHVMLRKNETISNFNINPISLIHLKAILCLKSAYILPICNNCARFKVQIGYRCTGDHSCNTSAYFCLTGVYFSTTATYIAHRFWPMALRAWLSIKKWYDFIRQKRSPYCDQTVAHYCVMTG